MSNEEHVVETPWGKLVTAKGLEILLSSFTNDLNRLHSSLAKIDQRINKLEMNVSDSKTNLSDPLLGSSFASIERDIQDLKKEQSRFAIHMKQTLELFYKKLETATESK
ncbi:MAG: hypothetical protein ACXACP_06305 [Candidatus Hodarchaeales archaeon]|jgi:hypothetical protein